MRTAQLITRVVERGPPSRATQLAVIDKTPRERAPRSSVEQGPGTSTGSLESQSKELDDEQLTQRGDRAVRIGGGPGVDHAGRAGEADPHPAPARDEGSW